MLKPNRKQKGTHMEMIASAAAKPRKSRLRARLARQRYIQAMAVLGLIWMIVFNYGPMYGLIIAFKNYMLGDTILGAPWVGLANFTQFFQDPMFFNVILNTLGISLISLLLFPLPIIFALLLNELVFVRFKKIVQTLSYLPHFLSWAILGGIVINWLDQTGLANQVLIQLGILHQGIYFMADPNYFWGIAVITGTWQNLGWSAIIYIAAITGVDPALHEAAMIDGASKLQRITHITLPAVSGTISIMLILAVANMLSSNFDQIFVLQNVLNSTRSQVIDTYVYKQGIGLMMYSYATAIGLFKSVIQAVLLILANLSSQKLLGQSLF